MREINFKEIRPIDGSVRDGFEEMCAQLFQIEREEQGEVIRVEGSGGDGGVESYMVWPDGKKVGMQAKHFDKLGDSQWRQMERSIASMLKNHPETVRYEFLVSLNRNPKQIQKWNAQVKKWKQEATNAGFKSPPEFVWRGETEIRTALLEESRYRLVTYWFDTIRFTFEWLGRINRRSIGDLDERYSPNEHVETVYGQDLLAFAGDLEVRKLIEEAFFTGKIAFGNLAESLQKSSLSSEQKTGWTLIETEFRRLFSFLWEEKGFPSIETLREDFSEPTERLDGYLMALLREQHNPKTADGQKSHLRPFETELRNGHSFRRALEDWFKVLDRFAHCDHQFILVSGEAGNGKSHLLADIVEVLQEKGRPVLFLLGEYFTTQHDPWSQVKELTTWDGTVQELLTAMNHEAAQNRETAFIVIDALNESEYRNLWKNHLQRFADVLKDFESIRLVISCRSDFNSITLPKELAGKNHPDWAVMEHFGFGGELIDAVEKYFTAYQIRASHFPPVISEFSNPLFLKTFCEAFRGQKLPQGPITFERVMEARFKQIASKIEKDIDCAAEDTAEAILTIAREVRKNGGQPIKKSELRPLVNRFSPSTAQSNSLYHHLKSNGLLVELGDPSMSMLNESDVRVRFPFERFADYFIARELISEISDPEELRKLLENDERFEWVTDSLTSYENRGLINALSIIVPEKYGLELLELVGDENHSGVLRLGFLQSVPWRSAGSFTDRSEKILNEDATRSLEDFWGTILKVANVPEHPFNADYLHQILLPLSVSERDEAWTIPLSHLAMEEERSAPFRLLDWTFRVPLELVSDEQARLVGKALAWFFTSNYKGLRNRSTTAATRLLNSRVPVVLDLLDEFSEVNDPYVKERLYAMTNGVAVREFDPSLLNRLATSVFDHMFSGSSVDPHLLTRDFAQSVLELAAFRGVLPDGVSTQDFRPPFSSDWPRLLSNRKIKALEKKDGWKRILESASPEGAGLAIMYGDFGRYVMQGFTSRFSSVKLSDDAANVKRGNEFPPIDAYRFIATRVHDLGWSADKFQEYDGQRIHGRQRVDIESVKMERIGKKYQWIALYELLGFLSDHHHLLPEFGEERPAPFEGAWQIHCRDFNPSSPLQDPEKVHPSSTVRISPTLKQRYPDPFHDLDLCADREAWIEAPPADFGSTILPEAEIKGSDADWIVLYAHFDEKESEMTRHQVGGEGTLSTWFQIRCWMIASSQKEDFLTEVREKHFFGNGCGLIEFHNGWIGDYPWAAGFREAEDYCSETDRWLSEVSSEHLQTICEFEGGDPILVPSPQLMKLAGLTWTGNGGNFADRNGQLAFRCETGGRMALIRPDLILDELRENGYDLIWGVLGERMCFDYDSMKSVVDTRHEYSAVYHLEGQEIRGGLTQNEVFSPRAIRAISEVPSDEELKVIMDQLLHIDPEVSGSKPKTDG